MTTKNLLMISGAVALLLGSVGCSQVDDVGIVRAASGTDANPLTGALVNAAVNEQDGNTVGDDEPLCICDLMEKTGAVGVNEWADTSGVCNITLTTQGKSRILRDSESVACRNAVESACEDRAPGQYRSLATEAYLTTGGHCFRDGNARATVGSN